MAFIPVPLTAQFNIRGTVNDVPMENVVAFRRLGGTPWDATALVTAISSIIPAWAANVTLELSTGYHALTVYARDLSTEAGAVAEGTFDPGTAGTVSGDAHPGNVAVCITHRTGLAGRSYRGRTYIGGIPEVMTVQNDITTAFQGDLLAAWNAFIGEMTSSGYEFVVVSRYNNNAPRVTGVATPVISSVIRDTLVDSQRRRLS